MASRRLTMAQAIVEFLKQQHVARDGREQPFFAGCFGIFGHGNVAGIGQALQQTSDWRYYLSRNEQAMVHTAAAFAKANRRLRTFACTSSIGPGATNMLTAAAGATINRLPVLLLPGDLFARRSPAPVLQQLESERGQGASVNDCFRPISRYWDRIERPEQVIPALLQAMRVLTSPAETGVVTLCLPQDVQAEAFDFPEELFGRRVWTVPRARADKELLSRAAAWIRESRAPLIIAGGGVHYSEANEALASFASSTGIPVVETQAGKSALLYRHPQALGAVGVTGTPGANLIAREADLVIGIGTRYSDFTTASSTAFQNPEVRFLNINVADFDAFKCDALPLVADARVTLEALSEALSGYQVRPEYARRTGCLQTEWDEEVGRIYQLNHGPPISQGEVIGAVNTVSEAKDVVVCAAGSLPGDLHKLWRSRDPMSYHVEYGYSCMGYEIAGGLGVKLADPDREVYVLVGDGSYLMMAQELSTAVQEDLKLTVVLLDNHGFASIGGLSQSIGSGGFGTRYRHRSGCGELDGEVLPIDYVANAQSLGVHALRATTREDLYEALRTARRESHTTMIVVETDRDLRVGSYDAWWNVPVAEVSQMDSVRAARTEYERARRNERYFL